MARAHQSITRRARHNDRLSLPRIANRTRTRAGAGGGITSLGKRNRQLPLHRHEQGTFGIFAAHAVAFAPDRPCPSHQGSQGRGMVRISPDRNRSAHNGEALGKAQSRDRMAQAAHKLLSLACSALRGFLPRSAVRQPQIAYRCGKHSRHGSRSGQSCDGWKSRIFSCQQCHRP